MSALAMKPEPSVEREMAIVRHVPRNRKRSILMEATEQFCKLSRPSQSDISKYKEQFYVLVSATSTPERRIISASLAANVYTPRTIAIYLALEDRQVAAPMLLLSPVLKEADFLNIITKCPAGHLQVIARRDDVSELMFKALVARNDEKTLHALANNPACSGFRADDQKTTETIATPARSVPLEAAQQQSVNNTFVSAQTEDKLQVAKATQEKALRDQSPKQPSADEKRAFWTKPSVASAEELLKIAGTGGKLGRGKPKAVPGIFADTINRAGGDFLIYARRGEFAQCASYVHQKCGLKPSVAERLIRESGGESLCLILRALLIPKATASQIILLLNPQSGRSVSAFQALMTRYDQLDTNECRTILEKMGANFSRMNILPGEKAPSGRQNRGLGEALRARREAINDNGTRSGTHSSSGSKPFGKRQQSDFEDHKKAS